MARRLGGNDVVDLGDPEALPGASHPRFEARVFCLRERSWIEASPQPVRARWALWAAKEAALKALRRDRPTLPFHPRRFEVSLTGRLRAFTRSALNGVVCAPGAELEVRVSIDPERLHAWVGASSTVAVERLEAGESPSAGVRRLALAMARRRFPSEALRIDRDDRIPTLVRTPFRTTGATRTVAGASRSPEPDARRVPLSLSHHGRFVACALGREGVAA